MTQQWTYIMTAGPDFRAIFKVGREMGLDIFQVHFQTHSEQEAKDKCNFLNSIDLLLNDINKGQNE